MSIYWPRSRSFEFDSSGSPAIGAKGYFFEAGTSTPKTTYSDAALTTPRTHPVVADGNGRWPAVFLDYGSYKSVATTSGGTMLWSDDNIPNAAPTDPAEGVDANSIFQTGDIIVGGKNGARPGFVRLNGRSIGSAASGATERANADCEDLFAFVWDNYANGQCAVSSGRGASAAADFAANKTIVLPDYRGAALTGFDDMGNSAASLYGTAPVITGSGILSGSLMGSNTHTILTAQLPAHSHGLSGTSTVSAGSAHTHGLGTLATVATGGHTPSGTVGLGTLSGAFDYIAVTNIPVGGTNVAMGPSTGSQRAVTILGTPTFTGNAVSDHSHAFSGALANESSHTHTLSGTTNNLGSDTAHNIMARSAPVTFLMKL